MTDQLFEHRAYIGLGSNLENPLDQVTRACDSLARLAGVSGLRKSPWYVSKAIGPGDQPDFINGVVTITTRLSPLALLREMQAIENQHGRQREVKWGARTLDLDLLLYDDLVMESEPLNLPHPHLHLRNFVVYPLADLAPELVLTNGSSLKGLRQQLGSEGLKRL